MKDQTARDAIDVLAALAGIADREIIDALAALAARVAELEARPIPGTAELAPIPEITDAERTEAILRFAVETHLPVDFWYTKPGEEKSERLVSPYEIRASRAGNTLLVGYDHDRAEIRQFRLDRITEPEAAEAAIAFHDNQEG